MWVHLKYDNKVFPELLKNYETAKFVMEADALLKFIDYREVERNKQRCFDSAAYCCLLFNHAQRLAEENNLPAIFDYCEKRHKQAKDLRTVLAPHVCKITKEDLLGEFGARKTSIRNPIINKITGPAQNEDDKNDVILKTINETVMKKDINYCKAIIKDVRNYYSRKNMILPEEIFMKISELEKLAINLGEEL